MNPMPGRSGSGVPLLSRSVAARWFQTAAWSQDGDERHRPTRLPHASDAHPWSPAAPGRRRGRRRRGARQEAAGLAARRDARHGPRSRGRGGFRRFRSGPWRRRALETPPQHAHEDANQGHQHEDREDEDLLQAHRQPLHPTSSGSRAAPRGRPRSTRASPCPPARSSSGSSP